MNEPALASDSPTERESLTHSKSVHELHEVVIWLTLGARTTGSS